MEIFNVSYTSTSNNNICILYAGHAETRANDRPESRVIVYAGRV